MALICRNHEWLLEECTIFPKRPFSPAVEQRQSKRTPNTAPYLEHKTTWQLDSTLKNIYIYISIIYDICLKEQFFQEFKNVQNRYSSSYGNSTGHEDHENVWIQQSNIGWVTCSNGIKSTQYISVYISLHQFIYISIHFSAIIYTFTYTIHSEYLQCDIRWATSAPQGPFFSAALPIAPACCAQGPTNRSTWRSKDV